MSVALVTGIAGQTGSYLAELLVSQGWDVHGIARSVDRGENSEYLGGCTLHNVDLTDFAATNGLVGRVSPDAVFNLAAISSVALSWSSPLLVAEVNGTAVAALLAALDDNAKATGRRPAFVQASSAEIFGAATDIPQTELTRLAPTNPYGAAKAYAHHLVGVYRAKGMRASSCILYNHESPRRPVNFVTRKITNGVARIAAGLDDVITLGNLDAVRDWGWAPDYAQALALAAAHPDGGDYVIATGIRHSIRDFARTAFAAAGIDDWERHVSTSDEFVRPTDAPVLVGDPSKAGRDLPWSPTVQFEQIVDRMVQFDRHLIETDSAASDA